MSHKTDTCIVYFLQPEFITKTLYVAGVVMRISKILISCIFLLGSFPALASSQLANTEANSKELLISNNLATKVRNVLNLQQLRIDLQQNKHKRFLIQLEDDTSIQQFSSFLNSKIPLNDFLQRIAEQKNHASTIKQSFWSSFQLGFKAFKTENIVQEFSHLPAIAANINSLSALNSLLLNPQVKAIYEEEFFQPTLSQSRPLISQPFIYNRGAGGADTTVVILDTGVNYTRSEFGSCTSPGVPASCAVIYADDIATDDGSLDDNGHGTNVSGIVLGTAPDTKLAVLDVFNGGSASSFDVISAINWAVSNQDTYNIVAMNLSLGDGSERSSHCENYYKTYFQYARNVGILTTISSGNDAHTDGISNPACNSNVISVGAVYDTNVGGLSYSACTDSSTAADQITCFSNSGSILDILAPGALITAGGYTMAGTSMAAPHVAGAIAVTRSQYPASEYSIEDIEAMLLQSGPLITDPRNNIQTHRLDLEPIFAPEGSTYETLVTLSPQQDGSFAGNNQFANKQDSEPDHAGNSGGSSMWFEWQAPSDGIYTFNTFGSDFDTLLAIYSGSDLGSLIEIDSCDDSEAPETNCQISIQVEAGQTFKIAVDGKDGATGNFTVNWNYEPTPEEEEIPFLPPIGYLIFTILLLATGWRKSSK
mgnify:FL=1